MAKLTLTDLVNLQNETTAVTAVNNNNTAVETALENTLSRDGTSPNQMEAQLDMNSNRIINLADPVDNHNAVNKGYVDALGTSLGVVTTTRGDLIKRGVSSDERLAIGNSGYTLLSNGTDPYWGPVVGGGGSSGINVDDYGAVGNGTTIDTTAFNDAFTAVGTTGGIVNISANKKYRIGNLTIPANVTLRGEIRGLDSTADNLNWSFADRGSTILLDGIVNITCQEGATIEHCIVRPYGLDIDTQTDTTNFVATTAIILNRQGSAARRNIVLGFNLAFQANASRIDVEHNVADCLNGLVSTGSYDTSRILHNQFWPYLTSKAFWDSGVDYASRDKTKLYRSGNGIYIHTGTDDTRVEGNLVLGYLVGIRAYQAGAPRLLNNWVDHPFGMARAGNIGYLFEGGTDNVIVDNMTIFGTNIGVQISLTDTAASLQIGQAHIELIDSHAFNISGGDVHVGHANIQSVGGSAIVVTSTTDAKVHADISLKSLAGAPLVLPSGAFTENFWVNVVSSDTIEPRIIGSLAVEPTLRATSVGPTKKQTSLWADSTIEGQMPASSFQPAIYLKTTDTVDGATSGDAYNDHVIGLHSHHVLEDGFSGNRSAGFFQLDVAANGPGGTTGTHDFWHASFSELNVNADGAETGGTVLAPYGNFYGSASGIFVTDPGTPVYWNSASAMEIDLAIPANVNLKQKIGLSISQTNNDASQGSEVDVGLVFANDGLSTHAGWLNGILIGKKDTPWPMDPNGTFIGVGSGTLGTKALDYGIDFNAITFGQYAFRSNGFYVNGGGQVGATSLLVNQNGLLMWDTDTSHATTINLSSNLTANRVLTIATGDADRTLDISAGNVTISSFGASLIDDANATAARTTLGVDAAGTDNSTDVTLAGEDFLSIAGQVITANPIDIDNLSATGTPSSSTFLRGDNTWAAPAGGGGGDLLAANNLSDVVSATTSRTNLGVGTGNSPLFAGLNLPTAASIFWNTSDASIEHVSGAILRVNGDLSITGNLFTGNGELFMQDVSGSFNMALDVGDTFTANRTLTLDLGDASRSLDFRAGLSQITKQIQTLTDGATVNWDCDSGGKAKVTLAGNRTMAAVTNAVEGASYLLWVIQDATGSRTITWTTTGAGSFDFGTDGAPTLTTAANEADILGFEALTIGGTLKLRYIGTKGGFA